MLDGRRGGVQGCNCEMRYTEAQRRTKEIDAYRQILSRSQKSNFGVRRLNIGSCMEERGAEAVNEWKLRQEPR